MHAALLSKEDLIRENKRLKERIDDLKTAQAETGQVRKELCRSEAYYRALFEHTGTAMMLVEEDTTVSVWNSKLEEVTGYNEADAEKGRKWTEFVVEEDLPRLMEYHVKRRQDPLSVPGEYEFRLRDKSGCIRNILINVALIPGTGQTLVSLTDVSGSRKTQKALQKSERKFRDLYENANDIIYIHDLGGHFISVNSTGLKTYGYTLEEVMDLTVRDLVDPDYHEIVMARIESKHLQKNRTEPFVVLTRKKNGSPVWVEISTRLIAEEGKPVAVQGIARDITERRLIQEELVESERRFRETADVLPGIICELDLTLTFTYVNRKGLETFGYTRDEFEKGISLFEVVPPQTVEKIRQDMTNVLSGDYGNPGEYEMKRKNGSDVHILSNAAPLVKNNEVCGLRACIVDITELKKSRQQLKFSEQRFRNIFTCSPAGIALFTSTGQLVDMNESFRTVFGIGSSFSQNSLFDFLNADPNLFRLPDVDETVHKESCFTYAGLSGKKKIFLDWYITKLGGNENEQTVFLAQVQDITERKNNEQLRLRKAQEKTEEANRTVERLKKDILQTSRFHNILSRSPEMKRIFSMIPEIAPTPATVLVTGESGTGKELIARSLHELSNRRRKPFLAINCSALPDNLLESELFGYKAGAFTDAKKDKPGKFVAAQGGTVFLDEIGDISASMQAKLLRVLQEKEIEPLGAVKSISVDVRIVAATNRDLEAMVSNGEFREDLFYRINVLHIKLPPLRERRCDIPILAEHFIESFNVRYRKNITTISDEVLQILLAHEFRGNIRELENIIEHAFIFCKGETIRPEHLSIPGTSKTASVSTAQRSELTDFRQLEKQHIMAVLSEVNGNRTLAAKKLGVHRATLFRKMKALGI
ncbi:MAG: PAS domain S-box protein [Chitinispirillaceae bacterium]